MKALVLTEKAAPVAFTTVEKPQILADESGFAVVQLKAAALNHRDLWIQKGLYAGLKYPIIPGSDGAGYDEKGQAVIINPSLDWGDNPHFQGPQFRVLGLPDNGTFAEFVKVPSQNVVPKPEHLSFEAAAALPLAGLTAYRVLFTRCQAQAGDKVLISGIGGGVALIALQMAVAAGCEVWVTSSADAKIEQAKALGAKGGVNYTQTDWASTLQKATGGLDIVIDSAVGKGFAEMVHLVNYGGRIGFYGATTLGQIEGLNPRHLFWRQISLHGSTMGSNQDFTAFMQFVAQHRIEPVVDTVFNLENGAAAFERMNNSQQFGKIVLSIA